MRTIPALLIVFFLCVDCQEIEPILYGGKAIGIATDGEIIDTLKTCYCWQTEDSLNFHIINDLSFYGISVDVSSKNNIYETSLKYYSDTDEFNGAFNLAIPVSSDSLTISFESMKDSIRISGYFEVDSEHIEIYGDDRVLQAYGSFNCVMAKK